MTTTLQSFTAGRWVGHSPKQALRSAINGQVVIRPMMYLALSYDHRIVDGREAVLGLVAMKDALEDPSRLLFDI